MPDETSPFADPAAFAALPRVSGLALSPDGSRLVATVDQPDAKRAKYVSSLWEVDPAGRRPAVRLTWSARGESSPAFLPDGSLLFVSSRPAGDDEDTALWSLPAGGEARALARYPGGVGGPVVAAGAGSVLVRASRPVGADGDGAERRVVRKDRAVTAILHTGMPIRYWDHEVGDVSPRLLLVEPDRPEPVDIAPDARFELAEAGYDISADGRTAVTTWSVRRPGGRTRQAIAVIDVPGGTRRLLDGGGDELDGPRLSPDGRRLAVTREAEGDFDTILTHVLQLHDLTDAGAAPIEVDLGEVFAGEYRWAPDGRTLYVTGDWQGRGVVLAVDGETGQVVRRLASDAAYSSLCPAPGGGALYALRSAVDSPPSPVRLDVTREDQEPAPLPSPAGGPIALPGCLEEVRATASDGATVRAWLCAPPQSERPAPVMVWIHGGPISSWNAWSWRWNPWAAVARGYAVLLADPALSTGYGADWFRRAWPRIAGRVWHDVEVVLDAVLTRPEFDGDRTACLGGSFGGYMTNWIAGHTERFRAIVTHAGLWALDQQHPTTDAASSKAAVFGLPSERPEWYAANSPHNFADAIRTPMLVIHGNRDYRVPVSEALRLWWDLVSRFDGEPDELPHRFLQFTGENHWILSPANAEIWYETVLGFCDQHVLGRPPRPSRLI